MEADGDTADKKMKKIKPEEEGEGDTVRAGGICATAACVSKQWHATARDERLWELICTKHWANVGCGEQQLRSVVLAFGGFRRLHSLYLWPLSKPSSSSSSSLPSSTWPCFPPRSPVVPAKSPAAVAKTRWGKDEVHLSLSLLSIRYYETMNFSNRGKGR
ncbi:F-box family protein [Actinidia rufa]|uniref:F-box family protein n=1 Tax=Actinidia rufa TaxID=165716 RepID=A0A7J0DJ47_9ERIC|nr:F-box family protein [Actinidia rufa]